MLDSKKTMELLARKHNIYIPYNKLIRHQNKVKKIESCYRCLERNILKSNKRRESLMKIHVQKYPEEKKRINDNEEEINEEEDEIERKHSVGVRMALSALKFYKNTISPLMLPSCRYVPSCSEYSIQSFENYGVLKGGILTAWRLLRCNPLGGKGYDPPKWPPVGFEWVENF